MRNRLKGPGGVSSLGVCWVDGALTLSDDLSLALCFAFGLGPSSDCALLALLFAFAFGSVFAFAFGLPLGVSVEGAGCKSLGGSPGFHVVCEGARTNRPLAPLFGSFFTEPDGASPCGGSSAGRSSGSCRVSRRRGSESEDEKEYFGLSKPTQASLALNLR